MNQKQVSVRRNRIPSSTALRTVLFGALGVGLTLLPGSGPIFPAALAQRNSPAKSAPPLPDLLAQFLEQTTKRVNAHHPAMLRALSTTAEPFAWTQSNTVEWQGDALRLPAPQNSEGEERNRTGTDAVENRKSKIETAPPVYLAVFHAWHTCQSEGDHVYRLVQNGSSWKLGEEIPEADPGGFRVRDHDLKVTLDFPQKNAAIRDRIRMERTQEERPAYALLRLSQDFRVQSIMQTGEERENRNAGKDTIENRISKVESPSRPVPFQQAGGIVVFAPPDGKTFALTLTYQGHLAHTNGDYIRDNEAMLNSYWYPHTARLPATATVTVTAPPGWTALAQGEKIRAQRGADGSMTVTYRNELPTSFFTLDVGKYNITTRIAQGRSLSLYQLKPDAALAKESLDRLESALAFFEKSFGTFPYTRYGLVETRGPFSGALEAYSFATFGPQMLPDTIPHELAHTWWGGMVPCTYTRSMWDEALAEYSDSLWRRSLQKTNKARAAHFVEPGQLLKTRQDMARTYDAFSLAQARDTDEERQSAVGYGKGALALRVLEEQIGQPVMLRCLQTFLADHPRGEAAEWRELEAAVRRVTGEDYRWFFAQWMERTGLPHLRLSEITLERKDGSLFVSGDIVQEGEPYRLRLPLVAEYRQGGYIQQILDVQGETTHFRLRVQEAPARLRLDPEGLIPLTLFTTAAPADADPLTYTFPGD